MVILSIGCGENKNALLAAEFLNKEKNFHIEVARSDKELLSALNDENFDAVIRGSLKSFNILKNLKNTNKSNYDKRSFNSDKINNIINNELIYRASFIKSTINDKDYEFLLGPVGIDEGDTLDEKLNLAIHGVEFMKNMGKSPKIAILAGGRKEDVGRSSAIDKSIEDSEKLMEKIENSFTSSHSSLNPLYSSQSSSHSSDFSIKNYYILIEKAIKEGNNIIIAPDGIIGNIIFRSLVLLSSWESYGAITFGIDKLFIDTSRDQTKEGYIRALRFAKTLVENKI